MNAHQDTPKRDTGRIDRRHALRFGGGLAAVGLAVGLLAGLALAPATALADAGTNASCMGHEASSISPPGSLEEMPGGMPEFKQFLDDTFPGTPPGAIVSAFAKLHEGSHEACDEAVE